MNYHLQRVPAGVLSRLLFGSAAVCEGGDAVGMAIARAAGRWPPLRPALTAAGVLVHENGIYQVPAEATELALVRSAKEWSFRAVCPSPTGLACSCDGWPPAMHAGPGDGLYCADILAYLLALYLQQPFSPLPYGPLELWRATLEELQLQMARATFNQWLRGSTVVPEASTPLSLTVAVRNSHAQVWLTRHLRPVIVRTLTAVAGYQLQIGFVVL